MNRIATVALGGLITLGVSTLSASPLFTQCPPTGDNTGCQFLITIGAGGAVTVAADPTAPNNAPYDGSDDTLVGIQNNSNLAISSLPLSSTLAIFGFEGDGPCAAAPAPASCPSSAGFDPTGYGGPGVTYSGINGAQTSGIVNFAGGLQPGQSAWFGLEESLQVSDIVSGPPSTTPPGGGTPGVPEPATIALMGSGIAALVLGTRRRSLR